MGKIIDTTNIIDSSTCLNVNLDSNMVGENYYLLTMQEKIDYDWEYRANKLDIKEENIIGSNEFTDIQVIIDNVVSDKSQTALSDDWKKIFFRDTTHKLQVGKRFKFTLYEDIDDSIWILVNINKISPTADCVIRRCDNNIGMVLKNGDFHYEPCILETEFKSINLFYDESVVIPQSQIYMILQYNDYTKKIKINDRFILGATDLEDRSNNDVFKVNATVKFKSKSTYDVNKTSLVYLGLNRTSVNDKDDLINRIAIQSTDNVESNLYEKNDTYNVKLINSDGEEVFEDKILLNQTNDYYIEVSKNNILLDNCEYKYAVDLLGSENDIYYYEFKQGELDREFKIINKKPYVKDKLKVVCTISNSEFSSNIEKIYYFTLGGLS